jgi:hypothetical protein
MINDDDDDDFDVFDDFGRLEDLADDDLSYDDKEISFYVSIFGIILDAIKNVENYEKCGFIFDFFDKDIAFKLTF